MFYGRESEFALIEQRFRFTRAEGGLIVLCGERRSGKTSILFQLLNGRLGPDFVPVLIDMQAMAIADETDFLSKIANEIAGAMMTAGVPLDAGSNLLPGFDREVQAGARPADVFRRFVLNILKVDPGRKIILLFDEYELFESKIDAGTLTEEVLHILSNLMETQRVFLVFTGSLNLEERRKEYWRSFLGRSTFRPISFLDRQDALRLITEPVAGRVDFAPDVVEIIQRLTAGQPFYTQAVCQNLVDYLNEHRTRTATLEALGAVMATIVSNAFPQMIFLWQGMAREEKLALALLGEELERSGDFATARTLLRNVAAEKYPVQLDTGQLATALENLFRREMLLRNDAVPPGFAFRMDLWRLWIRRMHSVWQVIRELGIPIRARRTPWQTAAMAGVPIVVAAAVGMALINRDPDPGTRAGNLVPVTPASGDSAEIRMETRPADAVIQYAAAGATASGYRHAGRGAWTGRLKSGTWAFLVGADGYRDSSFTVSLASGASRNVAISLVPRTGGIRITAPEGATVTVDGKPRGRGTRVVEGLSVPDAHTVEVTLANHLPVRREFRVIADVVTDLAPISLNPSQASLMVTTTPSGASVIIDGRSLGISNSTLAVHAGLRKVRIELEGHQPFDTSLVVNEGAQPLNVMLVPTPPGFLIVRGTTLAAEISVEGLVISSEGAFSSRRREMKPGSYMVRVQLNSGEIITRTLRIEPGEELTFNYTEGTESRRKAGEP